jgi:hypothetical protein
MSSSTRSSLRSSAETTAAVHFLRYVGIEFPRIESRRVIVAGFARVSVKHCRSRSRFAADIQWNSSWRIRRERSRSSIASN